MSGVFFKRGLTYGDERGGLAFCLLDSPLEMRIVPHARDLLHLHFLIAVLVRLFLALWTDVS